MQFLTNETDCNLYEVHIYVKDTDDLNTETRGFLVAFRGHIKEIEEADVSIADVDPKLIDLLKGSFEIDDELCELINIEKYPLDKIYIQIIKYVSPEFELLHQKRNHNTSKS